MADKFILSIDLGTSGPKVALVATQGEILGSEFEETPLILLENGGAEQSPAQWWAAIDKAVKRLLARGFVPASDIIAIATTGQWSGTVAVDESGQALGNGIIWMDARGAPYIREICGGGLEAQGYSIGKLIHWIRKTGGIPGSAGKDSIAHILYLKHARPDIYQAAYKFLEPMDYIGLRLTGRFAGSVNSMVLHWLTDNRQISNVTYDDALVRLSTIERSKLPDLQPANSILGPLLADIAHEWGLGTDVQVIMGSPDIHSAAVGSGAVRDFETHLYIGTSSWLTCHLPIKKTDIFHNLATLPSGIPGRYLLTDEQECAGVCLQFLRDNILFHQDELSDGKKPANAYQAFDRIAERTPAGSGRVIFLPWLYGERAPIDDRFVRGGFYNQSLETNREHMIRAVLEGVAFNSRWMLKYVEKLNGRRAEAINMVGGGARSAIWCQIHADVMDRPIRQMQDPIEVNVRGAALLASAALGILRYDDLDAHAPVAATFMPQAGNRKLYDELFAEFVAIYENNRKIYARLNRAA
jgi:xylulokinase